MCFNKIIYLVKSIALFVLFLGSPMVGFSQYEQVTIDKSDTVIDGKGGLFNDGKVTYLYISSKKTSSGWIQTKNVTIKNCTIKGGIRIMGMGKNGQAADVKESSLSLGHTERAQAAAPTNITLSNVVIETLEGLTLLYIAPGTTYVTIENSEFKGENTGSGPIVYLDAESGHNVFRNNKFTAKSNREVIACDGSAYNLFEGNTFETITKGGIYLYRNCGEGGAVRHQTPNHNTIRNNTFNLSSLVLGNYGIWLGSRNGNKSYCDDDAGYPFGSSIDDHDFADDNVIYGNTFTGSSQTWYIKDNGANNQINTVSAITPATDNNNATITLINKNLVFENPMNDAYVKIFDATGNTIFSKRTSDNQINLSSLSKGVCLVQLFDNEKITTKKIILQ
ncbi:MAG: T9SS type A sorting domain-containing protein [Paludibacteraceae bacterium]